MLQVPLVRLLTRHSLAVPVVKEKIWKKCLKQRIINPLTSIAACKLRGEKNQPPSHFRAGHLILAPEMPQILQENT